MERKKYAVIMAAGRGTRMGSSIPKQFIVMDGKPILMHTIEKFILTVPGIYIVTVLPKEYMDEWKRLCITHNFFCPQILVEGGFTRFHSVKNALEKVPDGAVAAIHDGVRPLVSGNLLKEMFSRMRSCRALIPILPSVDTLRAIKKEDGAYTILENVQINRSEVFRVQTPQIFMSEDIKEAYNQAYDTDFTDDASVALKKGIPLSFIEGEWSNIKITTPEDLEFAKAILSIRKK